MTVATIGTNANNDIYLGADGNLVMLSGLPAVAAACMTASRVRLGEEVLAQGAGLPMFEAVWNGTPNLAIYNSYLENTLSNVDSVTEVQSIDTSLASSGTFGYTATIDSEYGPTTITGQLSP